MNSCMSVLSLSTFFSIPFPPPCWWWWWWLLVLGWAEWRKHSWEQRFFKSSWLVWIFVALLSVAWTRTAISEPCVLWGKSEFLCFEFPSGLAWATARCKSLFRSPIPIFATSSDGRLILLFRLLEGMFWSAYECVWLKTWNLGVIRCSWASSPVFGAQEGIKWYIFCVYISFGLSSVILSMCFLCAEIIIGFVCKRYDYGCYWCIDFASALQSWTICIHLLRKLLPWINFVFCTTDERCTSSSDLIWWPSLRSFATQLS